MEWIMHECLFMWLSWLLGMYLNILLFDSDLFSIESSLPSASRGRGAALDLLSLAAAHCLHIRQHPWWEQDLILKVQSSQNQRGEVRRSRLFWDVGVVPPVSRLVKLHIIPSLPSRSRMLAVLPAFSGVCAAAWLLPRGSLCVFLFPLESNVSVEVCSLCSVQM